MGQKEKSLIHAFKILMEFKYKVNLTKMLKQKKKKMSQ